MTFGKHLAEHLLHNKHLVAVTLVIDVNTVIITTGPQILIFIPDCALSHPIGPIFIYADASFNTNYLYQQTVAGNMMDGAGDQRTLIL